MTLTLLRSPNSGGPLHVGVILCIGFIAHGSFTYFIVRFMQLLLFVNHLASSCAVYTLASVHAQLFHLLGQSGPSVAAGHCLLCKLLGAFLQRPGQEVGDGLPCFVVVLDGQLQPGGAAQYITAQGDSAVPPFLFLVVSGRMCSCAPEASWTEGYR